MPAQVGPALRKVKVGLHILWAAALACSYAVVVALHGSHSLLGVADGSTRSALYISLAATTGALLGFAITAITILLALAGGLRITWLYEQDAFAYVRKIFIGAIRALGIAAVYFTILIVADTKMAAKSPLEVGAVFLGALVILRLLTLIKLLADLLTIAVADKRDEGKKDPNPPFTQPLDD